MGSPSQPSFSSSINAATTSTLSSSNSRRLHSDVHSTPNHESSSSDGTPLASLTPDPTPGAASSSRIVTRKGPVTKGSLSPSTSVSEEAHGKDDGGVPQRSPAEGTNSSSRTSSQDCLPQKSTPSEARTGNSGKKTKVISSFYRHSRNQEKISNASHSETKTKDAQKEPPPLSSLPEHPSTSTQPGLPPASSALPHFRCGCGGISCGKCSHWKALDWRGTLEYRAAWDVEVWKAVQVERFRRQLEENKAAALTELQRRVQKQEKIEEERLKEKRRQLEIKEKGIRSEEHRQLQQRRRLEEAEKELTTSRQQLLEAQKHAEEEIRIQVRRVNEDYEHKTLRLRDQVTAAEAHSRRLEERLAHSEADYLHLFEEFHRFRTEHVVHGTGMTSSATGNTAQNIDPSLANTPPSLMVEMMRSRHAEELRALEERLEARYEHELRKVRQQCADLMEKNTQLAGALARRREQLRQLREQQHVFHPVGGAQPPTSVLPAGRPSLPSEKEKNLLETGGKQAVVSLALSAELERLQRERHRLIYESGGALGEGDPVVDGLSRRIILLQTQLQLGAEYTK